MLMTDIIQKKRDKFPLSDKELEFFVSGVTDKSIPDYQISALLMAIFLNGMDRHETLTLTTLMAKRGAVSYNLRRARADKRRKRKAFKGVFNRRSKAARKDYCLQGY